MLVHTRRGARGDARAARRRRRVPGTCRSRRNPGDGPPHAWRLDAGAEAVSVSDALAGPLTAVVDDFVVWRGDGVPAYNLAVVVDDADQGVGEVVRGDDLLETTPRQVLLARTLDLPIPRYAHVPLVLGPDGRRLAKRDGAVTLGERLALGERVEDVVGWMAASAGLATVWRGDECSGRARAFSPARITREPTTWELPG